MNLRCLERKKKKVGGVSRLREATAHFRAWVATKVFFVVADFSGSMSQHGPLCRNMVPRLQALLGRNRGFS